MKKIENEPDINQIFSKANQASTFADRLDWLTDLFYWIKKDTKNLFFKSGVQTPETRIKYLLNILDRNLEIKQKFSNCLQQLFAEIDLTSTFTDVGLGEQISFVQELSERVVTKLLPTSPLKKDFSSLLNTLFSDKEDIDWIRNIDHKTVERIAEIFSYSKGVDLESAWFEQLFEAKSALISQVRSFGLSNNFRARIQNTKITSSPFFSLIEADSNLKNNHITFEQTEQLFLDCKTLLNQAADHLSQNGISISLIFQIERTDRQLGRLRIINRLLEKPNSEELKSVVISLIMTTQSKNSIRQLFRDNYALLSVKVVERNSELGEHYQVLKMTDGFKIMKKSLGGGFLTSFTVLLKYLIALLPFSPLLIGLSQSLNFSISFVLIHIFGFTLATKQPSSTAAHLAEKLVEAKKHHYDEIVNSIFAILRAQIISVCGNILAAVPVVGLFSYVYLKYNGVPFLNEQEASYVLKSTDIFGPTLIYAAFTGFLLFVSSFFAGWIDNWFVYRQMYDRLLNNYRLRKLLGATKLQYLTNYIKNNATSLAASVSLGFLLGIVPTLFKFIGIYLDVRHVTLSSGTFALVLPTANFSEQGFLIASAIAGLVGIGILNISISFLFAFRFACEAKKIDSRLRSIIYKLFISKLVKKPWLLFIP